MPRLRVGVPSALGPGSPGYKQFASYDEGEEWHTVPNGNAPILDWETGNLNIPWIHFFTFLAMRACYVAQLAYQVQTLQEQVAALEAGRSEAFYLGLYNPAAITSTAGAMVGLGAAFTPTKNTHFQVFVNGNYRVSGGSANALLAYGSGAPPAHGAAHTGTTISPSQSFTSTSNVTFDPISGVLSGLSLGTQYWIDLSATTEPTNSITFSGISVSVIGLIP